MAFVVADQVQLVEEDDETVVYLPNDYEIIINGDGSYVVNDASGNYLHDGNFVKGF